MLNENKGTNARYKGEKITALGNKVNKETEEEEKVEASILKMEDANHNNHISTTVYYTVIYSSKCFIKLTHLFLTATL